MPIIRNPFRTRTADPLQDGISHPTAYGPRTSSPARQYAPSPASPLSISTKQRKETTDFKLSEINDSGVYLPPSPPEKKPGLWPMKSYGSNTSSQRSALKENEPFNISRESFDSYRRSFDISARSPVIGTEGGRRGSQGVDVRRSRLPPPASPVNVKQFTPLPEAYPEDKFEDVGLNDEAPGKPKKRGLFSRSAEPSEPATSGSESRQSSSHFASHLFTRKRGQSGQGAELGSIPAERPVSSGGPGMVAETVDPKPVSSSSS